MIAIVKESYHDERGAFHPAIGKCECGEELVLESFWKGALECPECGRWYNTFGQELLPPSQWEEDDYYDEPCYGDDLY